MEFISREVPKNFNLFLFGDVHAGTMLHSESGFDKFIAMTQKKYQGASHNVVIGMGDYIEAIDASDKRFDVETIDRSRIRSDEQIMYIQDKLMPIRKKIAGLLNGNHEDKLDRYYYYVNGMCENLGVPYGTYTAIFTFSCKGQKLFKLFATHGRGSINSAAGPVERVKANLQTSLKRKLQHKAGDCVIMACGHTHKLIVAEPVHSLYLTSDDNDVQANYTFSDQAANFIHPDHRWYLNTGSFMKLYARGVSGYAEKAMYDPMEQGFPVITVRKGVVTGAHKVIL